MTGVPLPWSPPRPVGTPPFRPLLVWEAPRQGLAHHAGLERDWKQLQRVARPDNPFLSWEWQTAWAAHHPDGRRPLLVADSFPDGTLAGLLALQRTRRHGLVRLEFLGQGAGGDELDCLLHPAAPADTARRLAHAALERSRAALLRLESARADGHLARALPARLRPAASAGECLPGLPLAATFDALLDLHSANFRSEVRRRRRAFLRQLPQASVEVAQTPAAVAAALGHLFRLHNLRRAQKADRGIFESSALRAFHLRAAAQLAARGAARVYMLRTPGRVVAALYGLEGGLEGGPDCGRSFLYFQSGFDPDFAALSPGTVMLSAAIEDSIRRRLRRFEFLRGDERYKSRWTTEQRHSLGLECALAPAGRAYLLARRLRRALARPRPVAARPPA